MADENIPSLAPDDWYQQLLAAVQKSTSTPKESIRPWWAPDAQGFLAAAIVTMTFTALMVRMFRESTVDDKMLDTMITILFSTCLVTVYQFSFGSSRGSQIKDDKQDKIIDKLVPPPAPVVVAVPPVNGSGKNGAPHA